MPDRIAVPLAGRQAPPLFRLPVTKPMTLRPLTATLQPVLDCRLTSVAPLSDHARAVHHEAVLIGRLARRLAYWLEMHQPPHTAADCAEWIRIMRDPERADEEGR